VPHCNNGVASLLHLQVFQGDTCLHFTLGKWGSVPQKEDSCLHFNTERGDSCFQCISQEGDTRELPNKELNNLCTSLDNDRTDGMCQMCSALNKFCSFKFII
jgi:hypothetical protein